MLEFIEGKYPHIENARYYSRISINEFCCLLGVVRKTYYNWQHKGNIPSNKLILMSRILNTSIDYLMGISDEPSSQKPTG